MPQLLLFCFVLPFLFDDLLLGVLCRGEMAGDQLVTPRYHGADTQIQEEIVGNRVLCISVMRVIE
mgnify:CR=1 FL=1